MLKNNKSLIRKFAAGIKTALILIAFQGVVADSTLTVVANSQAAFGEVTVIGNVQNNVVASCTVSIPGEISWEAMSYGDNSQSIDIDYECQNGAGFAASFVPESCVSSCPHLTSGAEFVGSLSPYSGDGIVWMSYVPAEVSSVTSDVGTIDTGIVSMGINANVPDTMSLTSVIGSVEVQIVYN